MDMQEEFDRAWRKGINQATKMKATRGKIWKTEQREDKGLQLECDRVMRAH